MTMLWVIKYLSLADSFRVVSAAMWWNVKILLLYPVRIYTGYMNILWFSRYYAASVDIFVLFLCIAWNNFISFPRENCRAAFKIKIKTRLFSHLTTSCIPQSSKITHLLHQTPWKSLIFVISFSRPGKSLKMVIGPWKVLE